MTAVQIAEQSISTWKHLKFILQDEVVTAMNAFSDRARKEALEEAAKICFENDEVTVLFTGKRHIEKKTSNNVNGNAYGDAILALQPPREGAE